MHQQQKSVHTLMVMAGGTGGHIYPAMAVADALHQAGWRIVWLCSVHGMEQYLLADKPYIKHYVRIQGVRGKGYLSWLLLPLRLSLAFWDCWQAYTKSRPDLALGMGGFVSFPGGVMAWLRRTPLLLHEQNKIAGLSNKVLNYFATRTLSGFPHTLPKAIAVGNPVRSSIYSIPAPEQRFAQRTGVLRVLVMGGSLGAKFLNELLPRVLASIPLEHRPEVVHQTGVQHKTQVKACYAELHVQAEVHAFLPNIAEQYAWADVVLCRAGALTIAELSAAGVASILVPFPFAVDDHQTHNAKYLSDAQAAWLLPQSECGVDKLVALFTSLNRATCLRTAIAAHALGKAQATQAVLDHCWALVR